MVDSFFGQNGGATIANTTGMQPSAYIAHYRIVSKLGDGGMGEVWRATDTKLGRDVAIKLLPAVLASDADRMARFQREAKVLASLNHPNIAAIYGVEDRALVMELIEGVTLYERIAHGPIPPEEAAPIALQIADALEYAHEHGIVHRDLKPANIMLAPDGRIKILDFGLAKAASAEPVESDPVNSPTLTMRSTAVGVLLGTAAYMAPEQARGLEADKRADIWSFGVTLYEMLAARRMFEGPTVSDTLAGVLRAEPDWSALPAGVPSHMRALLRRCVVRDPKRRLRDIGEARIQLESPPDEPASAAPAATARTRPLKALAATLAAALLGAGFLLWRATRQPDRPLVQLSINLGQDVSGGALPFALPSISPDGSRMVFPSQAADGKRRLDVQLLSQRQPIPLAGTEDAASPFFSPDGQWIAFFADGKLKKVAVTGGTPVTICETTVATAWWGEDGSILLGLPDGMARVSSTGGKPERLPDPPGETRRSRLWPQLLPGGKSVLFTISGTYATAEDEDSVGVASLSTGKAKILERGGFFGRYLPSGHLVFARDNTLFAVPFDLGSLQAHGTPVPVLADLATQLQFAAAAFSFSRNGTAVYGIDDGTANQLTVASLDRTAKPVPLLSKPAEYADPHISPDGSRLALAVGPGASHDVYVDDLARGNLIKITFTGRERQPVWTPDGKHLVYDTQASTGAMWWIRADGAGTPQPLLQNTSTLIPYSFSPDGRLAYSTGSSRTGVDIWTLPLDVSDPEHPKPGKPELFLGTPFSESSPAFSPDGRWMAYLSNESGVQELYVRPFPGPGGRWLISSGGARSPVWSRAGRELLYQTSDRRVMSVTYTVKGATFVAETPRPWPGAAPAGVPMFSSIDVSPDGKRLVYLAPAENPEHATPPSHAEFVLNFFDDLKRKAPLR